MNTQAGSEVADRGSATVIGVGVVAVLLALLSGIVLVAQSQQAAIQARGAADLAALAAASTLLGSGPTQQPCDAAATIARSNRAQLASCRVMSTSVQVEVTTQAPLGRRASGLARAGEAEATMR